jgi:hypothetical protein
MERPVVTEEDIKEEVAMKKLYQTGKTLGRPEEN